MTTTDDDDGYPESWHAREANDGAAVETDNLSAALSALADGHYLYPSFGWAPPPGVKAKQPMLPKDAVITGDRWPGHDPAKGGFHQACRDEPTIRGWWERWPDALPAVVVVPGLVMLDFDDDDIDGYALQGSARAKLAAARPDLARLVEQSIDDGACHIWSPGGEHLWFRLAGAADVRMSNTSNCKAAPAGELRRYVDVKGGGTGYGFAPDSVNLPPRSDRPWNRYELRAGDFGDLTPLPPGLDAALRAWTERDEFPPQRPKARRHVKPASAEAAEPVFDTYRWRSDSRHDAFASYAAGLARRGHSGDEIERRLHAANAGLSDPIPLGRAREEFRRAAESAVRKFGGKA